MILVGGGGDTRVIVCPCVGGRVTMIIVCPCVCVEGGGGSL